MIGLTYLFISLIFVIMMADLILVGQCYTDPEKSDRTRRVLNKFTPDVLCLEGTQTLHDMVIECAGQFCDFLKEEQVKSHPRFEELRGIYNRGFGGYDALLRYAGPGFPLFLVDDPNNPICKENEAELCRTIASFKGRPTSERLKLALREADNFIANKRSILIDANNNYGRYHNISCDLLLKEYRQIMHSDNMSRDIFMEGELRRIREEYLNHVIIWIGNISRLCEDADGLTA